MESWKDIKGFEGYYQISTEQIVRGLKRTVKKPFGFRTVRERIIKTYLHNCGYWQVLLRKEGKTKRFVIHRLVADAFIPNPLNLPQVNHKNGIKTDNRIENLEWVTEKQNINHAWRTGLIDIEGVKERGKAAAKKSRLPIIQLSLEGKVLKVYESMSKAQELTQIPAPNIIEVCKNRRKTAGGFLWCYLNEDKRVQ